jgi:hypothetical protein
MHLRQEKALRGGRGGGGELRIWLEEELGDVFQGSAFSPNIDHGTHEIADHVMKEPVGCDFEGQPHVAPRHPSGLRNAASVSSGLLAHLRKAFEGVIPNQQGRSLMKEIHIHFPKQGPTPGAKKGRKGLSGHPELVPITPGLSVEARVEFRLSPEGTLHPNVPWKGCIQTSMQFVDIPPDGEGHCHHLASGMDATIGATRRQDRLPGPRETFEGSLHFALDRSAPGLKLPTEEVRPVVVDG